MVFLRALLVLALVLATFARAQEGSTPSLEAARARWARLSPEEQGRLRERYESYKSLGESERAELAERARRLADQRQRAERALTAEQRARLASMGDAKRRAVLDELVEIEMRQRGARIREQVPEAWLERLEGARPEDRQRFLAEFKQKARERASQATIDRIARRLGLPRDEVERLKSLRGDARAAAVLELSKRFSAKEVEEFGLPPGLTREQWDAYQELPPEAFFEAMQKLRSERMLRDAERHVDAQSGGGAWTAQRRARLARLAESLRPRPEDAIDLVDAEPDEHARQMTMRRRERALQALRKHELLPEQVIDDLEALPPHQFMNALQRELPPPPPGHHAARELFDRRPRNAPGGPPPR